ncbi:DUF938 domain-containing protein [Pseudohongiella sp.]|uniref:SAM-dependent methyltransferase n=1 Tax=marine sediment metagenome TaxID=412755 RepID=A0A0F9WK12_9ZZZZ|nr:DUF938 domain-containing protein [Pseudohongiella sp.]HDZ09525.1 DUF938 domain-containing protein [Pseudohongiella sp.]HEA63483.1 DUF938 domain-containing protein [Pseudohongiella sp.]
MSTHASDDARRSSPSSLRNREAIGQVLQTYLAANSRVLEIAAGTGEHAVYLSTLLAASRWWPSDINADAIDSINAWRDEADASVLQPALMFDVSRPVTENITVLTDAGSGPALLDAIVCINMIHISPWQATRGLMQTAETLLSEGGLLYLYGPYQRKGQHTAQSNALFDADLRSRNPQWGIRDLDDVCTLAAAHHLKLLDVVTMPANNLSVLLQKRTVSSGATVTPDHTSHE